MIISHHFKTIAGIFLSNWLSITILYRHTLRHLFIYLFISTYNDIHMYDSGYYVEVKDDDDKNYYWKETDKDKEGWLKWVGR